jgi:subtilisin family serine protease
MGRGTFIRLLLAAVLAVASVTDSARAQNIEVGPRPNDGLPGQFPPRDGGSPSNNRHNNKAIWYVVGGAAAVIVGTMIGVQVFKPDPPPRIDRTPDIPPLQPISLPPPGQGPPPGKGQGKQGNQGNQGNQSNQANQGGPAALRNGFNLPPLGETRFVQDEVMLDIPSSVPTATLDAIAARHGMTRLETQTIRLTGRTLHRWRLDPGTTVPDMIRALAREQQIAGGQPVYLFTLAQDMSGSTASLVNGDQYAPDKLGLTEAHRLATGNRVLVAVIDSGVDASHPDLADAVVANLDAANDNAPHAHGTGMAGAIAAHRSMLGTAPRVGLLTVRAFSVRPNSADGTTFNIIKGLDWAVERGARVINMSFAGPSDPRLRDALARVAKRGVVLVAAAGNAGPQSPPLFPAADPNVIAVTATDVDDKLFSGANRGNHIAVAAPGVDILAPSTGGTYQFTTGTSVASAQVSGVVALLLERNPSLTPADVRRILTRTAKAVGPRGGERDYGSGLVDAYQAVSSARSSGATAAAAAKTKTK